MIVPLAHAGHWIANMLYAAPVFVVVGALAVQRFRDRRDPARARQVESSATEDHEPDPQE